MRRQVGPWNDRREVCHRCLDDYLTPDGMERVAVIQLCGEWLCRDHYERALDTEKASVKLAVKRNLRR